MAYARDTPTILGILFFSALVVIIGISRFGKDGHLIICQMTDRKTENDEFSEKAISPTAKTEEMFKSQQRWQVWFTVGDHNYMVRFSWTFDISNRSV